MMMRKPLPASMLLGIAFASALQAQTNSAKVQGQRPVSAQAVAAFDAYVARAVHDWHVPGLAIALVASDSVVLAKGYGVIETGKPTPINEHTRFAIGSTTKAMTALALGMLVDEGKVRWDGRVIDYLPGLRLADPYVTSELTIRDLLTHRSGLGGTDLFWGRFDYPPSEQIQRLRYIKPAASFRSRWQYQNVMYALGGVVIEKVSGMPWEEFMRQRVFAPLGMNDTEALVSSIVGKPNVAVPHDLVRDTLHTVPIRSTDRVASAGSVWSSVADMAKWMRFMLDSARIGDKRLVRAETYRELVTPEIRADMATYPALSLVKPHTFNYAFGWFVQDYQGQIVWMHTGSIDGMSALIGLMPDRRMGVYVLANVDHAELRHALMYRAFDLYNANPVRDWSTELKSFFDAAERRQAAAVATAPAAAPPSLALERYVGTYADSAYGTITVTLANGALQARIGDEATRDLEPWHHELFRTREQQPRRQAAVLVFQPDGTGNVSAVRMAGVTFTRTRNQAQAPR